MKTPPGASSRTKCSRELRSFCAFSCPRAKQPTCTAWFPQQEHPSENGPQMPGRDSPAASTMQVLLLTSAEDLDCTPGFQQKVFHINQPAEFIEDQSILNLTFSDCKGNDKLRYEVSSPYFKVNSDGGLVALRNITAVGKTLFVHARTPHAEDMAELVIVGGKDIQGSLQDIFKFARTSPVPRQKRSIVVSPILIPENQRQPFPRDVGKRTHNPINSELLLNEGITADLNPCITILAI
ncbi:cadherin-13 isoform X3 [Homo sapiens]|uniref:cadherin-13 isoform X3 n=1 Tax=Homo sapiens TaxID=9606 RepID=UPI0023DF332E|nr:cadherin-13 isoform X3 [Homo sapiens]